MINDRTTRRAFLEAMASALSAAVVVSPSEAQISGKDGLLRRARSAVQSPSGDWRLECAGWRLSLSRDGDLLALTSESMELVNRRLGSSLPWILISGETYLDCSQARVSRSDGAKIYFEYQFTEPYPITVEYSIGLRALRSDAVALEQTITLNSAHPLKKEVEVHLRKNIQLPGAGRKVFLPLKNGVGRRRPLTDPDNQNGYAFEFAGGYRADADWAEPLAIPLIDEYGGSSKLHATVCADPTFSTFFRLARGEVAGDVSWRYLEPVGVSQPEQRSIYTILHSRDSAAALNLFYETALAEVTPGPAWLHEVAMVNYDYLSKNGKGWYADIDALTKLIPHNDRHRVVTTLHGWYDVVGRYAYDQRTRALDPKWVAFPNARDPEVQRLHEVPNYETSYQWHKASVEALQPVEMSLIEMHRRIRYAKERGFRVILYFADGLNSCEGAGENDPRRFLQPGGWVGPDTKGAVFCQNPLHPGVRDFYTGYLQALLNEYGKEIDGFVWDETYTVDPGSMGTEQVPGYAARAMMSLVKDLTAMVSAHDPNLAFLASDCIGLSRQFVTKAPYCLVAHGTYQDSHFEPEAWPYGLFPNYRNVLWSCNWAPVTSFSYTEYGVKTFGVPVAISNGCFGDDTGISEMKAADVQKIMALFAAAKPMKIGWIEETGGPFTYNGQKVVYREPL